MIVAGRDFIGLQFLKNDHIFLVMTLKENVYLLIFFESYIKIRKTSAEDEIFRSLTNVKISIETNRFVFPDCYIPLFANKLAFSTYLVCLISLI